MLFKVWPLGKDGETSYGGTASTSGGRTRSIQILPMLVMVSEPATPISITASGVRDLKMTVRATVIAAAITVIHSDPPRWVKKVATRMFVAVRSEMASVRAGRSNAAIPSPSSTAS